VQIGIAILLFLVVITLAIDSIFGVVEAIVAGFVDLKKKYKNEFKVTLMVLAVCFLGGIPFTLGAGLYYLDILDHFVGGYLFMIVGFLECFVAAYLIGPEKIREWINGTTKNSKIGKWFHGVLYFIPIILGYVIIVALHAEIQAPYEGYPEWALNFIGRIPLAIVIVLAFVLGAKTRKMMKT
jgi:NSS family neurotransmitter:Na+ symporter